MTTLFELKLKYNGKWFQVKGGKIEKADFKLPIALRSVFGGFIGGQVIVCGGFKSRYLPIANIIGNWITFSFIILYKITECLFL